MFQDVDYFNIEELLTEEEKLARNTARDFFEHEVRPLVVEAFHLERPLDWRRLAPELGRLGFIGPVIPAAYGGGGTNYTTCGLISREAEKVDSAVGGFIREETALVMYPVWRYGSETQKRRWLPAIARGEAIGCFGLTEPDAGSDVAAMTTTARRDGGEWVINGSKQWISEAADADMAVVWAQTGEGVRGFIVERGTAGFAQSFERRKGSMRAGDVGGLSFTDCRVPEDNALPGALGLRPVLSCLDQARFAIAWGAIGVAADCYETALGYARERRQFDAPIASYQLVQEKLVDMLVEITKGQLLAYRLGRLMDAGKAAYTQISLAKKNNAAVARMCAAARELLGANGVSLENSPIRHMANMESVYTYQGTDHNYTLILGADITGIPAFRTKK
ncbi:MAG: acyl-CoA dehydrogenase family protein [Chloroflexi bacterium]|nr:acyl-CoA dehydrogenase family protein [Chloroflexota bacterium]